MKDCISGCGMEIREDEGFVCPFFCRKSEWVKENGNRGCCQIDLQIGTNVCLHAPQEFFESQS